MSTISTITATEILDSRGVPTVQATVLLDNGISAKASAPSGASKGIYEAKELRDEDPKRFLGKGVLCAVKNIEGPICSLLRGKSVFDQAAIDMLMIEKDGTENKSHFGANAMVATSCAVAKAASLAAHLPLYRYLGGTGAFVLPCPMLNIINGGAHAQNSLDFQEFMICPHGFFSFQEALRAAVEVFYALKEELRKRGLSSNVGDEGGFAPDLRSYDEVFSLLLSAIVQAGYKPEKEISLAIDCAASGFYDEKTGKYFDKKRGQDPKDGRTNIEQIDFLADLVQKFPALRSIEDGLAETDWAGWQMLTKRLGKKVQIVGDDLFVTNPKFLRRGIQEESANAILIKLNQIGTVTETLETIRLAKEHGLKTIISHRSGETEDTFIADFAVATGAHEIKTGAPCRSERVAKYNRLLEIAKELGTSQEYC